MRCDFGSLVWEKVQTDKDRVQDSYEYYKKLEKDTKERYEMFDSWCEKKKKSYEEYERVQSFSESIGFGGRSR